MSETAAPIYCFNDTPDKRSECIYEKCEQFSVELDMCKLELLKNHPQKKGTPTPRRESPFNLDVEAPTEKTTQQPQLHKPPFETGKYVNVQGVVVKAPEYKEGERRDGSIWQRVYMTLNIDGVEIGVTLWDELAEQAEAWAMGQYVSVQGLQVKEYKGEQQLSSAKYTKIL